jgi:hypothetical protein
MSVNTQNMARFWAEAVVDPSLLTADRPYTDWGTTEKGEFETELKALGFTALSTLVRYLNGVRDVVTASGQNCDLVAELRTKISARFHRNELFAKCPAYAAKYFGWIGPAAITPSPPVAPVPPPVAPVAPAPPAVPVLPPALVPPAPAPVPPAPVPPVPAAPPPVAPVPPPVAPVAPAPPAAAPPAAAPAPAAPPRGGRVAVTPDPRLPALAAYWTRYQSGLRLVESVLDLLIQGNLEEANRRLEFVRATPDLYGGHLGVTIIMEYLAARLGLAKNIGNLADIKAKFIAP